MITAMNYFFLLLIFIHYNIILINEESLILLCSFSFSWLVIEYLSTLIKNEFKRRSLNLEKVIKTNLNCLILTLKLNLSTQIKLLRIHKDLGKLATFCYKLISKITIWSTKSLNNNVKLDFLRRLELISNTEKQISKIITVLLISKLEKTSLLSHFLVHRLNNQYFLCIYKTNIRNVINLLSKK